MEALLAGEGQRLAFEPPDLRLLLGREGVSTLGGVAAANASGPRRVVVGACRDHMIGLRFVDGRGEAVSNGGRVMKNVTGYDLVKLMAGSWGRLGVMSEIAFRLQPMPETEATLTLHGARDPGAVMAAALATPYEVSGAAMSPSGAVHLRLEGFADSVRYRLEKLEALPGGEAERLEEAASRALWRGIRDVEDFAGHDCVMRLSLRPSRLNALREVLDRAGAALLADWGGGLVWAAGYAGLPGLARDFCAREGGHATLIRGEGPLFQPEAAPVAALTRALRETFDPRGILNPGLD
ncbi:putative FAD-linked oxidoreductase [Pseudogemmobacter humi]|uniref:Putative FAD-linked oxidoreductase n=1 Tax=Pseudogemmobacter humi TaxID=2483812 RepID=A0A3P5WZT3_9RHOB|nr:putative FAD-linked oxidoreductase [Pseudogemmobacter humi]